MGGAEELCARARSLRGSESEPHKSLTSAYSKLYSDPTLEADATKQNHVLRSNQMIMT